MYKTVANLITLYESKNEEIKTKVSEARMLKCRCGVTKLDRIRNECVTVSLVVTGS